MKTALTSTDLARRIGDVLAEVKYKGNSIVVTKNGEPVAELRPLTSPKSCTLAEFIKIWNEMRSDADEAFAEDLAAINRRDQPLNNPWA